MNYLDPKELEPFLRLRIAEGHELDKLDFKRELNFTANDEKANLVRLISAFANTYSLEHDDYGFLIFGVDKNTRNISHDIEILRTKGADKLDSEISQLLEKYLFPVPRFQLMAFEEPLFGTWGCLITYPNQTPPFVFKKEYTSNKYNWRVGEWRVRRGKKVCEPNADDFGRALQGRVQSAIQPLREEISRLRDEVKKLEGRLEGLTSESIPQLEIGYIQKGKILNNISLLYTTPRDAGFNELKNHKSNFENHLEQIRFNKRDKEAPMQPFQSYQGWVAFQYLIQISDEEKRQLKNIQYFLNKWGFDVSEEDITFDQAWLGRPQYSSQGQNCGPDAKRVEAVSPLIRVMENVMFNVNEAHRVGGYLSIDLGIHNSSKVAAKDVRVILQPQNIEEVYIVKYALKPKSRYSTIPRPDGNYWENEVRLSEFDKTFDTVRPGEIQKFGELAVKILKPGKHKLIARVLASNFPEAKELEININFKPDTTDNKD